MPADRIIQSNDSWALWSKLEPFVFRWNADVVGLARTNLQIENIHSEGRWRAPSLEVDQLRAALFGKSLDASGRLNVATRQLAGSVNLDFDTHRVGPMLTEKAQRWLDRLQSDIPPHVFASASLTLPAWTNRQPDWRGEVSPTISLSGSFDVGSASFKTVPLLSAQSHFTFSNLLWNLPDLVVQRPEGRVDLQITHNSGNERSSIAVLGRVMARDIGPLVGQKARDVLNLFDSNEPAFADCVVCGPWSEGDKQSVVGDVTLTNFTFRGERFDELKASLLYTNRYLAVPKADLRRESGRLTSSGVGYDFDSLKLSITNALNTIDPLTVAKVISPKFAARLSPYKFGQVPKISAHGVLGTGDPLEPDLHFDIQGEQFNWWKFNLPQISGSVHWTQDALVLTNIAGLFYNGQANGHARFDLGATDGSPFSFLARTANADLRLLMHDLTPKTNHLEGLISGELNVVAANTANWQSWQGLGNVSLRNGLIWEIPMFGILSPVLNSFWPGLGNSRADQGAASFAITNSIITTKDLEIRSQLMRLHYDGTIDFSGQVNARAEAELLRDAWLLGPFISAALSPFTKLFEFRVTGTLNHPKKEPLFIPKVFMMPFHPFRSLKEIFSDQDTPRSPLAPDPLPPRTQP